MLYLAARSWGIMPSEFWGMTVAELMAEIEARPDPQTAYAGGMTEGDIEEIKAESAALRAQRAKSNGT